MSDERFIELWNDYLEGDLDESGIAELRTLVASDDRLLRMAADSYQMHRLLGLAAQDSPSHRDEFVRATLDRLPAEDGRFVEAVMQHLPVEKSRQRAISRWLFALAAVVPVVIVVGMYLLAFDSERPIARVTGLNGSLQWTGNGGRIFHDLTVGEELPGGTVEGMTPSSWFELEFNDGSVVTISGNSMLTFSDHGQKKLYLKEGVVSGDVRPQPAGKPMLIYTRSAMLEVVGTQFEVEAEIAATRLNVSEGKVRIRRLSDGNTVDVPARHRVIAAADQEMRPTEVPEATIGWKSQLSLGPEGTFGRWSPKTDTEEAKLGTIPLSASEEVTAHVAGIGVSRGDAAPVVVPPGCRFRVRGRMASPHETWFGVTVRYPGGGFAGRFATSCPPAVFPAGKDFKLILDLKDFQLDRLLDEIKDKLPSTPFHLVVESVWCYTVGQQVGLEISEMELLSPAASTSPPPVQEPPIMDIWAATSQGDVDLVKRHLASGTDINTAFIAPGVPASGATPLHLAVLFDQRAMVEFLIDSGASINAPAKDEYGGAPLHWAAVLGRVEIARRLVDAGADVNVMDKQGTPLDSTRHEGLSESEARLEIAELLRAKGGRHGDE